MYPSPSCTRASAGRGASGCTVVWPMPWAWRTRSPTACATSVPWCRWSSTTCTVTIGIPSDTDQTWRSCRDVTPGVSRMVRSSSVSSMPRGVPSISTSSDSRTSCQALRRMSTEMSTDTTGSATFQPKASTSTPATMAATEPAASASTWAIAARTLALPAPPPDSTAAETRFSTRPSTATTSIGVPCTRGGSWKRRMASRTIHSELAPSTGSPTEFFASNSYCGPAFTTNTSPSSLVM